MKSMKTILSLLLCVILVFSLCPQAVLAEDAADSTPVSSADASPSPASSPTEVPQGDDTPVNDASEEGTAESSIPADSGSSGESDAPAENDGSETGSADEGDAGLPAENGVSSAASAGITLFSTRAASIPIELDGITYSFTLNDDNTATLTDIANPDSPTDVTVPETFEYEGQTYTVTALGLAKYVWGSSDQRPNVTALVLPDTLESVDNCDFDAFPSLTQITIPGSVKNFSGCFQNMDALTTVIFEEGVETINLNNRMMFANSSVTTVTLPSTLTELGDATFSDATNLTSITLPAGITKISYSLFENCTSLEQVIALGEITSVEMFAFQNCTALKSFNPENSAITSIEASAFNGCSSLTEIPDLSQVTEMGARAFYKCESLAVSVDLSSLSEIPDYAFSYAPITEVKLSNSLTSIGVWAFLKGRFYSIDFPETLESIGKYAFWNVFLMGDLTIPDSVTYIGDYAFQYIFVTNIHVGEGLTEIGSSVFANNDRLQSITFDNAADDLSISSGAIPSGVEITYLKESIGDVGDTISDEADALTLQEAVNASNPGDVITISKHVKLDKTLTIPAGKDVTIRSEENFSIIGNKEKNLDALITVEAGASVTFDGELTLSGRYNSGSIVSANGSVTLTGNAAVSGSRLESAYSGVICVSGADANLTIAGGRVENNTLTDQVSGVILVRDGASVSVQDGFIQNNKVIGTNSFNTSSGILLYGTSSGEMTGGTISGNSAYRGSAIMLYGPDYGQKAEFTLSDGVISGNTCTQLGTLQAAGAVYVEGAAAFTMTGGSITGNVGQQGAGVCVADPGISNTEYETTFILDGGTISTNTASTGGGIYSYSNHVILKAGTISGNTASMGGGVYSEGNTETYSTLHMTNAVITGNSSGDQGGGMYFCSTGEATVYIKNGAAIYGNTAEGAGDDLVSVRAFADSDSSVTLADRVLGGGRVLWYKDGGIYRADETLIYAATSKNAARYTQDSAESPLSVQGEQDHLALKAIVDSSASAYAERQATLFITGNTASARGGGVAANGGIVIGEFTDDLMDIPVEKIWEHGKNPEESRPLSVTVKLMLGDVVMDTLVLSEEDAWTGTFRDLPKSDDYTIVEEEIADYDSVIAGNAQNGFTITNTYNPPVGSLTVSKTVSGDGGDTSKAFDFTVTLSDTSISGTFGDMTFENGTASFTLKHGESKTAENLPAGISYTVTESGNDGYTVTAEGDKGTIPADETVTAAFENYRAKDSEPTPTPTPTPGTTPTPEPTGTPEPSETPVPTGSPAPTPTPGPNETPAPTGTPNPDTQTPQTGDHRNFTLYFALILVSGAGALGAALYGKKKKQNP